VIFLLNASIAFCLNISVVFLIKNSSSIVYCLSGIVKDILLIIVSSIIFWTNISDIQAFGYTLSLSGIVFYNFIKLKQPLTPIMISLVFSVVAVLCFFLYHGLNYHNASRTLQVIEAENFQHVSDAQEKLKP